MFAFPGFFLGFYNYFKFKENYRPVNLIGIIVSSLFVTHPFLFFFYCLIFGFLLLKNKLLKDLLLLALGIIGFNSFWILPFVSSMIYKAPKIMGSYTQKLISTFSDLSSYQNSFLFMGKSFDSIQKIFNKGAIFIIISTLLLTVILFYSISVKKVKYEKFLLVILFVLLIFSIGPRPPFGFIYSFLESNVSFFVYFRSFQNALIPAYIIFLILITYSLNTDKKTRMIISLLLFIQIFSFFIFLNPLIINKGNEIPNNYFQLKQLMDSDNTTNRILLLPTSMYDYYKWDEGIENSDRYFLEAFFNKKGVSFYRPTLDNKTLEGIYSEIYNNPESGIQLAKENGIKYILIRKDLLFENKNYYKKFNYDLNNLNKLMDNDNFVLYEIDKTKSYVNSSGNLNFIKLSPVEIDLEINNLQKDTISLLEANYQGWKLFIEKYNENTLCKEGINKECLNDKLDKVSFSSIQLINKTNVPKNNSENDYINTWDLNKDYVVKNYSNKYYRLNNDGSINVKAKIYFVPQIFLYLGIILSLFFYVLAFLYVVLNNKIKDEN